MSADKQQDNHRPPSDGGMAKEEFIRVGDNALQDCGAAQTERRVCKETHRVEQRDPAPRLWQGLHRQRSQVRWLLHRTRTSELPSNSRQVP